MERDDLGTSAPPGVPVEVRSRYGHCWTPGFEIVETVGTPAVGYRLRRRSDRSVLPAVFAPEDVREARPSTDEQWWT